MTIINKVSHERLIDVIHTRKAVFGMVAGSLAEDEIRKRLSQRFGEINIKLVHDSDRSLSCDFALHGIRIESKSIEQTGLTVFPDGSWVGIARMEHTRAGERVLTNGEIIKTIHISKAEVDIITISLHNITKDFDYLFAYPPELSPAKCRSLTLEQNKQLVPTHLKIDSRHLPSGIYTNIDDVLKKFNVPPS